MNQIKERLAVYLGEFLKTAIKADDFKPTPSIDLGDVALPCFNLAKVAGKNPVEFAKEISQKISVDFIDKAVAVGPYVNFFVNDKYLAEQLFVEKTASLAKKKLLKSELTATIPGKMMIEYSQPNTHKEFHIGHLRTALLGAALVNLNRYLGKTVISANYIGDSGVHVAKCLWNLRKNHAGDTLPENKGEYLGAIYSEAAQMLEADEKLMSEVSAIQTELMAMDKDSEIFKLWAETVDWSMESFKRIYDLLGIKFDVWLWESEEEKVGAKLIKKILKEKKIKEIKESEGAIIADLREYGLEVLVLVKSDGNALYGSKDLPLGIKKFEKYAVDKSVYVVDKRQALYLKQIFKLLDLIGYSNKEKVHVAYDFVTLPEGAMASRKGNVVAFEKFFAEMMKETVAETEKRHADWAPEELEEVARKVSLSALKFSMLKYDNQSPIIFEKEKAMSLEGDTGPYLLYVCARINSILKQVKSNNTVAVDFSLLKELPERKLLRALSQFEEVVIQAAAEYSPGKLCTYLIQLAQEFNSFYHECPILKEKDELKSARLALLGKVNEIMVTGLTLLNIESLKEM